jgi:hypothetical protein
MSASPGRFSGPGILAVDAVSGPLPGRGGLPELERRRCVALARPPAGIWMPQVGVAERDGWPDDYTNAGVEATKVFSTPAEG